jgi:hypothetical protein
MSGYLFRARSAALAAVAAALIVSGVVAGAAGDPLIIGEGNDGGASQTILLSTATGASFTLKTTNHFSGSTGIFGWASASTGVTRGVYGRSDSSTGKGVMGFAANAAGVNYGVWGESPSASGSGMFAYNSGSGVGFKARSSSGNPIEAFSTETDREFYVNNTGTVFADGLFVPGGADLAELLPAVNGLRAGDLLVIGADGRLEKSSRAYQSSVAGVYSTKPGFLGGGDGGRTERKGHVPLAVIGVVPVRVNTENGPVRPGDLLTSSATPGQAMKADAGAPQGTIVGKALGSLERGSGLVRILLVLQ